MGIQINKFIKMLFQLNVKSECFFADQNKTSITALSEVIKETEEPID